jgi:hypothetical protein
MTRAAMRTALNAVIAVFTISSASAASAACSVKSGFGTGPSASVAKFEAYEGLLKATDWSAWASFMLDGSTPGYSIKPVKYVCKAGTGLGVTCTSKAKICKL